MAPKQALVSAWPTRYLTRGNRNDYPSVFMRIFTSCRRRFAEAEEVLHGHASPVGFWRHEFAPSPGPKEGVHRPLTDVFTTAVGEGKYIDKKIPSPSTGEGKGGGDLRDYFTPSWGENAPAF